MSILQTILGSGNVIEKGLDLIDDMHTSTEEEIEANSKAKTDLLTAYAPFKITQRYLALMFGATYLVSFFTVLLRVMLSGGSTGDIVEVINQFYIGEIMLSIIIFYFGGGMFEGGINAVKKRGVK